MLLKKQFLPVLLWLDLRLGDLNTSKTLNTLNTLVEHFTSLRYIYEESNYLKCE